ncbi:7784_t:CDS:2, partial [Dentiscutata erythropus]
MFCGKLDSQFNEFYSAFWKYCNSNTPDLFKHYWNELITNYSAARQYLQMQLYERRRSWACGFTTTLFILGIETTSFVESQNICIKYIVKSSNTSLCELSKAFMGISKDRIRQQQYKDQIRLTVNSVMIFSKIEALVRHYLYSNVVLFLVDQMKESIFYTAYCSNINEVENMPENELSNSKNFEDENDSIYIYAYFLLQHLNHANINEVARFNMQLINIRWIPHELCEDAAIKGDYFGQWFIDSTENIMNISEPNQHFKWLQPFNDMNMQDSTDDSFMEKQLLYGKVGGIGLAQQTNQKGVPDLDSSNKENMLLSTSFKNSLKVTTRGSPKFSNYHNNKYNQLPTYEATNYVKQKYNQPPTHKTA